jgi:glycosyltransferase involved in cell wall biosynthesis
MRLNWFSPLPPAETDVAHYTARLLPYLAGHADLTLWTAQSEWDPALAAHAAVRRYDPDNMPWSDLNRADLTIYHLGNDPRFHVPIWQVSRCQPGLVVIHDPCMQEFFLGTYRDVWKDKHGYMAHMERYYGPAGRRTADDLWEGRRSVYDIVEQYPLTRLACEGALVVLAHSRVVFQALQRDSGQPLVFAPLPYPATLRQPRRGGDINVAADGSPYRLVVFGYLGRNRGLDGLLLALAEFSERDRFRLDVYGPLWDPPYVRERIRSLGLERHVALHGFTPPSALDRVLATAHLAVNLRFPTMGESSGSQLRIWDHVLPSLVTRTGWYATIPDDAVAFVRPGHEVEDIQLHLRAFLADPERFARMGERGRRMLEEHHQPAAYVRAIIESAAYVQRFGHHAWGYCLAERAAAEMGLWLPPTAANEPYARVAAAVRGLTAEYSGGA